MPQDHTSKQDPQRRELLDKLSEIEFSLFHQVQNEGGPASCQNDRRTFDIMRGAQFSVWSNESLRSWLMDLESAILEGRNPFTEKYGYMMASTDPEAFARIGDLLPPVSDRKKELAERYIGIYLNWVEECLPVIPMFCSNGRPVYSSMDTKWQTSKETYLRGELYTYSEETLNCLDADLSAALASGRNLEMEIDDAMAVAYGYASAVDCEKKLSERS